MTPPPILFDDLIPDLVTKILAAVPATQPLRLVAAAAEGAEPSAVRELEGHVARLLTARGLRLVDRENTVLVRFTCAVNLRERMCAAEIARGDVHEIVAVGRGFTSGGGPPSTVSRLPERETPLAIELKPLVTDTAPILDLVFVGDREHVLVLAPSEVSLYERGGIEWTRRASQPITAGSPWPRDVRGRLRLDGVSFEAWLPGTTCRGTIEPLGLNCLDEARPWPVGIENTGMAAGRNSLKTPDGRTFFAAASLGPEAGARWLLVTERDQLFFLDEGREPIGPTQSSGEDVVALTTPCAPASLLLLSVRPPPDSEGDTLRLFRARARQLTPVTPAVALPGSLTALWGLPGGERALAVARNPAAGRYEAYEVGVNCGR